MTTTQSTDAPSPAARAGRREWTGLAVLVLPCLLISMDMSVLLFGLPFISADLRPSATQQLWIMDAYGFALAGLLITMGAVGDRFGRRRLLLVGAAAFGAASLTAAYSGSAEVLIGTRALLGVAGATLMPSTLALIRNMFLDDKQRATAIAVWTGGMVGGVTVGPIVGGVLLDHFWWGSVFLINLPAMALLLVLGPMLLPEFRAPRTGQRFDIAGSLLSMAAVFPTVYGIKELAVDGFGGTSVAALAAGLLLGLAFVVRQRTAANPLVDMELFREPSFRAPLLVNVAGNFVLLGFGLFNTQYLQSVAGMRPFTAALWSLAAMPFVGAGMGFVGALGGRVRPAKLIGGSLAVSAAGALVLVLVHPGAPIVLLMCGAGMAAGGVVAAQSLVGAMVLAAVPAERAGAASALNETAGEFGGAMGMALLGSVGAAFYHHKMAVAGAGGLPADAVRAARETVGSAVAVAGRYPGAAGDSLLSSARDAYATGLHLAAVGGAVVLLVSAVFAVRALRYVPIPTAEPEPDRTARKDRKDRVAAEV